MVRFRFVDTITAAESTEWGILQDGTVVDVLTARMEGDSHLPDHWRVAIYERGVRRGSPLIESYPLPPETHQVELAAIADELIAELS